MAGQWWFSSHHVKYKCFMPAACVDSSLQLSISAETIHTESHFKLLSEYKTWIPAAILHHSIARCQSGSMIYPLTSVFCTIAAHVPHISLSSKNSRKEGDCKSNSKNIVSEESPARLVHCACAWQLLARSSRHSSISSQLPCPISQ
jgi:hypothetical protein